MSGASRPFDGTPLPEVEFFFASQSDPGGGTWRVVHAQVREGLSELYECSLVLATTHLAGSPEELFDHTARFDVRRADLVRTVHGHVRRVEDLGTTGAYRFARVVIVPALWTLSQRRTSRIYQDLSVVNIVREVLKDAGVYQGGRLDTGAGLDEMPPREYCVQYRETDLEFVLRLLQEEGIPFYFRHDGDGGETLVLADDTMPWPEVPTMDASPVGVLDAGMGTASTETVRWFDLHREMRPTSGTVRDFDFTRPRAVLDLTNAFPGAAGARPLYDYPARLAIGDYNEGAHAYTSHNGSRQVRVRHEEQQVPGETGRGAGNVAGFLPGARFELSGHARPELDRAYLVTAVEHTGHAWADIPDDIRRSEHVAAIVRDAGGDPAALTAATLQRYANRFVCIPATVPFRPARTVARPLVQGIQTATVMAEPGSDDEICVDHHGRILVRFHWERPEQRSTTQRPLRASCWIRVAQSWAGAGWGAMVIPRVGMEVVVSFLEGDPDRPLVTGCVYNGENNTPYPLPAEKTKTTFKTSSSPGGDGFNELRFEDLKNREQIFVHAQRDHDTVVRNNQTLAVGRDRTKTVAGVEHVTVQKDRVATINQNESLEVEGNRTIAIHGGSGMSTQVDTNFVLNADASVTITCGSSRIVMTPDEITIASKTVNVLGESLVNIKGALVKINCAGGGGGQALTVGSALENTRALLQGEKGDLLNKLLKKIDPAKLADQLEKGLGKLLDTIGVPERVRERLTALGKSTAQELLSAVKEGRKPNWGALKEQAVETVTTVVEGAVQAAFKPLVNSKRVQRSPFLKGLVTELQATTVTAATAGTHHALGIDSALTRDPFWTVIRERHGAQWREFLQGQGEAAAGPVLDRWIERNITNPKLSKLAQKGKKAALDAIAKALDRVLGG